VLRTIDLALLRALRTHGHEPRLERLVLVFTRVGEHGLLWHAVCAIGIVFDRRNRRTYLRAMSTVAVAYLANIVLKYTVGRRRPRLAGLPALSSTVSGLAFPSAHAATSFAAARSLSRGGALPAAPLYATAKAMALSRVYVGVHYPTDIAAGAALGAAIANLLPSVTPNAGAGR
jgi:membrane-associated phospholipid phosphatase